jgi:hypothetical protein
MLGMFQKKPDPVESAGADSIDSAADSPGDTKPKGAESVKSAGADSSDSAENSPGDTGSKEAESGSAGSEGADK